MPLSPLRAGKITASFAPWLMAGDAARILNEWFKLTGDPRFVAEDFSADWGVQFGIFIERFALDWHERRKQQELCRRGAFVVHPTLPHVGATLDAYRPADNTVVDVKAIHAASDIDQAVAFYTPQMVVQRACVGADYAALLIVHGGQEPLEVIVPNVEEYEARVFERIDQFWRCVQERVPPVEIVEAPPVTPPEQWRDINLDTDGANYNWAGDMAMHLRTWADSHVAAKVNETAREEIKRLLPENCRKLRFEAITVARNRARAVSIKLTG